MHLDHAGSAGRLRALTGARLMAGRGDCFERDGKLFLRSRVGRTHIAHFFSRGHVPAPIDLAIASETEVLPGIRAVLAPGHTAGSVCYVIDAWGLRSSATMSSATACELSRAIRMANQDDALEVRDDEEFAAEALRGVARPRGAGARWLRRRAPRAGGAAATACHGKDSRPAVRPDGAVRPWNVPRASAARDGPGGLSRVSVCGRPAERESPPPRQPVRCQHQRGLPKAAPGHQFPPRMPYRSRARRATRRRQPPPQRARAPQRCRNTRRQSPST